ncbi:Hypothetical protein NTJ_01743 [Nesidiocoris tenuis]|uniref:Uncharacterized protein n=1 Tax=Nesidiocoris tenuis TaxID=355587 RepID=A0ABN7ADK1_9HEMI|nr:Hypothetical protein NTJ_01743 [Nesidiocoris tenuis]
MMKVVGTSIHTTRLYGVKGSPLVYIRGASCEGEARKEDPPPGSIGGPPYHLSCSSSGAQGVAVLELFPVRGVPDSDDQRRPSSS